MTKYIEQGFDEIDNIQMMLVASIVRITKYKHYDLILFLSVGFGFGMLLLISVMNSVRLMGL